MKSLFAFLGLVLGRSFHLRSQLMFLHPLSKGKLGDPGGI